MRGESFDRITRAMATGTSRRGMLRAFVGGLAGLAAAAVATRPSRVEAACLVTGAFCFSPPGVRNPGICCSGLCDPLTNTCLATCEANGVRCVDGQGVAHPEVCCSGSCTGPAPGQVCTGTVSCATVGQTCGGQSCCSGLVCNQNNVCIPVTPPPPPPGGGQCTQTYAVTAACCNQLAGPPYSAAWNECISQGATCQGMCAGTCAVGALCPPPSGCSANSNCFCWQSPAHSGSFCTLDYHCNSFPTCVNGTCAAGSVCVHSCCDQFNQGAGSCLPLSGTCQAGQSGFLPGGSAVPGAVGRGSGPTGAGT